MLERLLSCKHLCGDRLSCPESMRKRLPIQYAHSNQHYVALSAALHQVVTVLQDAQA